MKETNQEQYLRILINGPQKTLSDAVAAQWLIDKGYAKGHVRDLSHFRSPTDANVEYVWQGITHDGRIFIEQLQAELTAVADKPQGRTNIQHNKPHQKLTQNIRDMLSLNSFWKPIVIGLLILLIWHFIKPHL